MWKYALCQSIPYRYPATILGSCPKFITYNIFTKLLTRLSGTEYNIFLLRRRYHKIRIIKF